MLNPSKAGPVKAQTGKHPLRVAVLVNGVPHPTRGASVVLFFHYIQAICAAGFDVLCISILRPLHNEWSAVDALKDNLSGYSSTRVEVFELPRILEARRFKIIDRRDQGEVLRRRVREFEPDAVICFDLECAALAKDISAPNKMVWLGDLAFDSYWYNFLYGLKESPLTLRSLPYAIAQRHGWKRVYRETLAGFSEIIVSSKSSETKLEDLGIRSRYAPYPWPTPVASEDADAPPPPLEKPTFIFFGTLVGLGSRSSFHFMFDRLYPLLTRRWGRGGFEILIAGREKLPEWVARRLQTLPEFRYLGFVEDLEALVRSGHALIAPLDVPVGNRSRILTGMALKALVIAHENAALGNPDLVYGKNCLLARSAEEFAACMARSVDEPKFAKLAALAGYRTYVDLFSPGAAAPLFASMVKDKFGEDVHDR